MVGCLGAALLLKVETLRQLHNEEPHWSTHGASHVSFAGEIVGEQKLPGRPLPLLIVAGAHFEHTLEDHDDLARSRAF